MSDYGRDTMLDATLSGLVGVLKIVYAMECVASLEPGHETYGLVFEDL